MQVRAVDERRVVRERDGADFVVFVYTGGDAPQASWRVDSWLITDAELSHVLRWLGEELPVGACWSLGVIREPTRPEVDSDADVIWIVGSDVLNIDPANRSSRQQQIAEEMLARRDLVDLP